MNDFNNPASCFEAVLNCYFFLLRVGGYDAYNGMRALYFLIFRRNIQHQHKDSAESAHEVCGFYFSERVLLE